MSARGSTRPSGWTTFGSLCTRTTWTIASVSRMLARNWLPSPSPRCAPATRPAMSWKAIVSGTTLDALTVAATDGELDRLVDAVGGGDDAHAAQPRAPALGAARQRGAGQPQRQPDGGVLAAP